MTRLALALLLVAGCGQPTPRYDAVVADTVRGRLVAPVGWYPDSLGATVPGVMLAFDPGPAMPDSGPLALTFRIPNTDNMGTCAAPIPDSTYPGRPIFARIYRERRVYPEVGSVYSEAVADTFPVTRGTTVSYWRRVPCDTFDINVILCNGRKCSCRVYKLGVIVTPSLPPTPEMLP